MSKIIAIQKIYFLVEKSRSVQFVVKARRIEEEQQMPERNICFAGPPIIGLCVVASETWR